MAFNKPAPITFGKLVNSTISSAANVGAGEDNLLSYSIPANTLDDNGEVLKLKALGSLAANANNKRLRLYLGGVLTYDSGNIAAGGSWCIELEIIRITQNSQKLLVHSFPVIDKQYSTAAVDLSTAITVQFTAEAVANNDVVQEALLVEHWPAAF